MREINEENPIPLFFFREKYPIPPKKNKVKYPIPPKFYIMVLSPPLFDSVVICYF